ncbi:MAG: hypothetical protein PF481_05645 [Bacteroidales bacterium]|jgi:hypothetical protein|nr:hypothetical protein [Bacteroidales bacterium]
MEFRKHSKRNQTNRNLIVIAVGFLATVMAGALVFQVYMKSAYDSQKVTVLVTVDNQIPDFTVAYSLDFYQDSVYHDILQPGVFQKTIDLDAHERIPVSVRISDSVLMHDTIFVSDTSAYVFIQIEPSQSNKSKFFTHLNVSK